MVAKLLVGYPIALVNEAPAITPHLMNRLYKLLYHLL